ncbi:hypothetical protein OHA72_17815 [Dactylosporangium sp. NBC_01737]|uniref:hypothetical protein n=1 Tax=Dactylosporangium sp. NBC_01737 TaxID=2975959 RepID=UPI002E1526E0|nr:hypothetical protein OHA72_17815 [Dactylosporangium sp. NBC_01737]
MASAVALMRFSSMLQPNLFQLFQPMTGAATGPGAGVAVAAAGPVPTEVMNVDTSSAVAAAVRTRLNARGFRSIQAPRVEKIESVEYCGIPASG